LLTLGLARWSPGIARLFSYNLDAQIPYLVYESCPGVDLSSEVRRACQETGGGFPADKALELMTQITSALAFAHGRGIVYVDLKPSNLLLSPGRESQGAKSISAHHPPLATHQIKLTDFGTTPVSAGMVSQTCPISSREGAPLVNATTHIRLLHGSNSSMYM